MCVPQSEGWIFLFLLCWHSVSRPK